MTLENYELAYAGMSDDEILRLACEASTLTEEARRALTGELSKRKLTEKDVLEYGQHLASVKAGEMAENKKYLARSFLGFGTAIYGKRDFHWDGSYTTTKWITLCWLPVFPLESFRLARIRPGATGCELRITKHYVGHGFPWTTRYWVYSEGPINRRQVVFVYTFVVVLVLTVMRAPHTSPQAALAHVGALCIVPWALRKAAARPRDQSPRNLRNSERS
jgi:hypothetical protein